MKFRVRSVRKAYALPGNRTRKGPGKKPRSGEHKSETIAALRDCSLEVPEGGFTAVVGRSGCGKTTLLRVIAGLERPDSGEVEFPGGLPRTGFMFQDPRLLPWLTVEQNLALAFPPAKDAAARQGMRGDISRALALTGIADRAASYPRQLSGGMAQRAALARCLCRKPSVLLLDEPLGSLDAFTRARLRAELDRLWRELGLTVILVTHDIEEAVYLGSRVALMENGTMVSETPVPLDRPRDYRSGEFQELCARIENSLVRPPAGDVLRNR
ncbi:MAG: ABC transporter ATP-binding protein [Treponema sp.]|jgi:sulfonate transport system ATP-binding protein|nr:ABC transporter ATP-binding protein [Treponema sp.]